ncbi:hypothetical protein [Parvularcula maris]|uniref:Uncharacterized protein n=1 Tax=Parvularcula maris TaxID=2965077 RepID=A0A9X2L7K5_9PROT|nr:hypothetical protein [Parvularcula maris]MCQ8184423.1 hypothetical protein [Parvularcula maris]
MTVHFKARRCEGVPGAPAGGYARVFGRFDDFGSFEEAVTKHFRKHFRYDVVECEDQAEIGRGSEPGADHLIAALETYPIRYQSLHLYDSEAGA